MSTEEWLGSIIVLVKESVTIVTEKFTEVKDSLINDEIFSEYKSMETKLIPDVKINLSSD